MLGVNKLMHDIHPVNVLCSGSSLSRISALGVDGRDRFLFLNALRRKLIFIFGLQDQGNFYTIGA